MNLLGKTSYKTYTRKRKLIHWQYGYLTICIKKPLNEITPAQTKLGADIITHLKQKTHLFLI